jgi:hypothetical protein
MSFEEKIITEKYINKLRNICNNEKYDYTEIYYQIISKYIFNDTLTIRENEENPIILADLYFSKFKLNEELPFVIKTELEHELISVEYMNQKIMNDKIKNIKHNYLEELANEAKIRVKLNDGEIIERNEMLLQQFKTEFGYDPFFQKSKKSDFLNIQLSDNEDNTDEPVNYSKFNEKSKKTHKKEHTKNDNIIEPPTTNETDNTDNTDNTVNTQSGTPSLEILNNIIEILNMDFNNIVADIIDKDNKPTLYYTEMKKDKCKKPRATKKSKEEELKTQQELATLIINNTQEKLQINTEQDIIKQYIKLACNLKDEDIKSPQNKSLLENGTKAALQLASFYDKGDKLIASGIKANMIYIYLIKKFNVPEAMYMLGQNLLIGNSIMKNFLHGAKLIKVAAEKYKHKNAIIKLKSITRTDIISQNHSHNNPNTDDYVDSD